MEDIARLVGELSLVATVSVLTALFLRNVSKDKRRPLREAVSKTAEIMSRLVVWVVFILALVYGVTQQIERWGIPGMLLGILGAPSAAVIAIGGALLLRKYRRSKPTPQP